jgi:hypothetical protein
MSPPALTLFGVEFHAPGEAWLAGARHLDRRMELVELAADAVSGGDDASVLILPAGFLLASTTAQRDAMANALLALSKRAQIGIVFGIDVTPDDLWAPLSVPPEVFAYGCDEGQPLLWPAQMVRGDAGDKIERCVSFATGRIGLIVSAEIFNAGLRERICRSRPEAIVVLAHARANRRWAPALAGLDERVPTLIVGQELPRARQPTADEEPAVRAVSNAARTGRAGFQHELLGRTSEMSLHQFRLVPAAPKRRAAA